MNAMTKERRLGHIDVRMQDFCDACKPYPEGVLKAVVGKLPSIAYTRNEELLTIIKVKMI